MPDPTGRISHLPEMHRGVAWKEPVRCATTGSITIATALNAGDTIDGVTLAAGDRVLVKDNASAANGIYVAGATPTRAYDMDQDATSSVPASEVLGAFVYVIAGGQAGTLWYVTNTAVPTIGVTTITFAEWTGGTTGYDVPFAHGAMGATETIDIGDGTWHTGTLDADCTITVAGFTVDQGVVALVSLTQDGTGGWAVTWDADVVWAGDDQPGQSPGDVTWYSLWSDAGDGTVYGAKVGGGTAVTEIADLPTAETDTSLRLAPDGAGGVEWAAGGSVGALDDLSDVTISAPAEGDTLRYVSGEWINDDRRWEPITTNPGGGPELVWDGDDIVMNWRAY